MKARMKKLISMSMLMVVLVLLIVLGTALANSREPVSISGEVNLGTFTGTATVTIGGEELEGTVAVTPMLPPEPKDGGLYFPEVQHVFTFEDGSILNTTGEEFAMPADDNEGVLTLHGNMEITGGAGVFEGASGELRVNGDMDFPLSPEGEATFKAQGVIYR